MRFTAAIAILMPLQAVAIIPGVDAFSAYHSKYGDEETDAQSLIVKSANLDATNQPVHLKIGGLCAGYVHELHAQGVSDANGRALLRMDAYYTLNRIPKK